MDIVRNFINISGLAGTGDLPEQTGGIVMQYSDAGTLFVPDDQPEIKSIFQAILNASVKSARSIRTPAGSTVILDGIQKIKLLYAQAVSSSKANCIDLELPFNTFIELPRGTFPGPVEVYLLDAYLNLIDPRKIYCHFVYLFDMETEAGKRRAPKKMLPVAGNESKPSAQIFLKSDDEEKDGLLIDIDAEYL